LKKTMLSLIITMDLVLTLGCAGSSEKKNQGIDPPQDDEMQRLPDSKSVMFDFGILRANSRWDLSQVVSKPVSSASHNITSSTNFWRAESKLKLLTKEVNDRLAFAASLLEKGQFHEFQLIEEDQWVISFTFAPDSGQKYLVNIYVLSLASDLFEWRIELILNENKFDENAESHLLMQGRSDNYGEGNWKVFDIKDQQSDNYEFEVAYALEEDESRVLGVNFNEPKASYSVLSAGSFVRYAENSSSVSIEIDDVAQPVEEKIVWKKASLSGSYFDSTGYQVCWASAAKNFVDSACGE